jgi:pimeloyl-ACP methyl ester carboxylesterase
VFAALSELAPPDERRDAAGIGDAFSTLWTGAKEALRLTSYWNMKERAGVVGERGLGAFITQLDKDASHVRVHLIGHSFGARVVSFALKGLPANVTGERSPVKSVTLIQGAFSHFAFANSLPHAPDRSGALTTMAARVDGPLLVTHSVHDLAVCKRYPQVSFIARQDAADADDTQFRFGAMGADGAQAVEANTVEFGPVGQAYPFAKGKFLNLNGDDLITQGDPPSGAHSDIFYPEIAWAVFRAAGVTR